MSDPIKKCVRCGRPFNAKMLPKFLRKVTPDGRDRHCDTCQTRNLFDGLGMPTPPELLDKHTLKPSLTDRDFQQQLTDCNPPTD